MEAKFGEVSKGGTMPKRYSLDEIKSFIEIESNSGCKLVSSERKRDRTYFTIKCSCGENFETLFYRFKDGQRSCKKCSGKYMYSIADVRRIVEEEDCKLISDEYKNTNTKLKIACSCGSVFATTLKIFTAQKKTTCDNCTNKNLAKKFRKTNEAFDQELLDVAGEEIIRVGDYGKMSEKVLVRHTVCNHEWLANPSDLLHKSSGCPNCKESKGERSIKSLLDSYGIRYVREYRVEACRNKRPLPFDFAIFDDRENIIMLVEYDGVQHFDKSCFGGSSYLSTVTNDKIKNEYCLSNSIPLIRISYKEFNDINKILTDALKLSGVFFNSRQIS